MSIAHHCETSNALDTSVRSERKRLQRLSETVPANNWNLAKLQIHTSTGDQNEYLTSQDNMKLFSTCINIMMLYNVFSVQAFGL